jgi:O-antigen/teichoic acid export membrane protein
LVALIALVAKPLIRIWATASAVPTTPFILWLSIYVMIGVALMPTYQFLSGVERLTPLVISTALCAIAVIGSGIMLARVHGLVGLPMAMALSKLVTFWPIQVYEVRRVLRESHVAAPAI